MAGRQLGMEVELYGASPGLAKLEWKLELLWMWTRFQTNPTELTGV